MSNKSSENYLDNLLDSIVDMQTSDKDKEREPEPRNRRRSSADDEFLRAFEEELESDAYKEYFSDFELELEAEQQHDLELHVDKSGVPKDLDSILNGIEENSKDVEAIPSMPNPSTESAKAVLDAMEQTESLRKELGELESLEDNGDDGIFRRRSSREEPDDEPVQEIKSLDDLDDLDNLDNLDDLSGLDDLEEIGELGDLGGIGGIGEITGDSEAEGEEAPAGSNMAEPELKMTEAGEPDLSGLGDDDLMDILAQADDLSDIGDILSVDESGDLSGAEDSIEDFARKEMQQQEEGKTAENVPNAGKKQGFFEKLKLVLFGADEEETDEAPKKAEKQAAGDSPENLSEENRQILKELEGEEDAKKGKKKKEKKEKKPKAKKEKPKKAPKPKKPPKPKKEKKPKEKDNTPPLPKGPVIMILVMAASLVVLILLGTSLLGYQSGVQQAATLYNSGNYTEAFAELQGMEIKENDLSTYQKAQTLAAVDSQYQSYLVFHAYGDELSALDSLICAAGRYDLNQENAASYGCVMELEDLGSRISNVLSENYGMTMEEAVEIYNQRNRTEYSVIIHRKLIDLGLEQEAE
jgi:hypothetical protein